MKYWQLLIGLLIVSLATSFAAIADEDAQAQAIAALNYFNDTSLATLSREAATTIEGELKNFLSANSNNIPAEQKGRLLMRLAHLHNFNKIREALAKCLLDSENSRKLPQRILEVAAGASFSDDDCTRALRGIVGQAQDIQKTLTSEALKQLLGIALAQSERNTFHSYLEYRRHHTSPTSLENIVSDYCRLPQRNPRSPLPKLCDNPRTYLEHARSYTRGIPAHSVTQSSLQVARSLNEFLVDTMFLEKSQEYDITDMNRLLLVTPGLRKKIDSARETWNSEWDAYQKQVKNKPTQNLKQPTLARQWLSVDDIDEARDEMAKGIRKSQLTLVKMNRSKDPAKIRKELKLLLSTNPVAIGQTLIRDPDYTPLLCELIQEIYRDDFHDEADGENLMFYAGVVGGGLLATGALAWAAPLVFGAAASTALTTTTAVSFAAASAIGVAETAYTATQALEKYNQAQQIETAILSTNADQYSEQELNKALEDYHTLMFRSVTDLGLSATGLGALTLLARSGKLSSTLNILREMLSTSKFRAAMRQVLSRLSPEQLKTLLLHLGDLSSNGIRQVLEQVSRLSGEALGQFISKIAKLSTKAPRNYVRQVKWTNGQRLYIRSRKQGQPRWNPLELLSNPIATLFDRRRQVTIPVSLAGESAVIAAYQVGQDRIAPSPDAQQLEKISQEVEGGRHILSAVYTGLIDIRTAAELLDQHKLALRNWVNATTGEARLPRGEEFLQLNLVNKWELKRLDELAREAYADVHSPGGASEGDIESQVSSALFKRLQQDPAFSKRDPDHLGLLANYPIPLLKVDTHSDSAEFLAMKKAMAEDKEVFNVQPETYRQIYAVAQEGGLGLNEVYSMISTARNNPADLKERQRRVAEILPSSKHYLGQRPSIPIFSGTQKWKIGPQYSMELKDELDAYKLFQTHPYFADIKDAWAKGDVPDTEVLVLVSTYHESMGELMAAAPQGTVSRDAAAKLLYDNPLFGDLGDVIPLIGSAPAISGAPLTLQEIDNCTHTLVQSRATYLLTQADIPAQQNPQKALASLQAQTSTLQGDYIRRCGLP